MLLSLVVLLKGKLFIWGMAAEDCIPKHIEALVVCTEDGEVYISDPGEHG